MSSADVKEIMNELYDALLTTTVAVAVSMASNKGKGTLKLALAVGTETIIVKWLQKKKYLPADPFTG